MSDAEYKPSYYPPYVSGGGFIMTQPLAQILLERMNLKLKSSLPTFPIDDAFLGQLLSEAGLTSSIRNNRGFKSWGLAILQFRELPKTSKRRRFMVKMFP